MLCSTYHVLLHALALIGFFRRYPTSDDSKLGLFLCKISFISDIMLAGAADNQSLKVVYETYFLLCGNRNWQVDLEHGIE